MAQDVTQITLSIADRVRGWSRQERDLAIALRGLHILPLPTATAVSPLPQESALSIHKTSPLVVDERTRWVEHPVASALDRGVVIDRPAATARPIPTPTHQSANFEEEVSGPYNARRQSESAETKEEDWPAGPFDDFIAAVTTSTSDPEVPPPPLPPPSRFMVRVAPVGKPHRSTKRNYDYFEELNASLATQATQRRQNNNQN